jgi:hypothetical protein
LLFQKCSAPSHGRPGRPCGCPRRCFGRPCGCPRRCFVDKRVEQVGMEPLANGDRTVE